ncbi:MAG: CoA-binding protein [Chloroflexi bacterium]|nr:CoA-binding protein [Chloroflexota bacterium]
MTAETSYHRTEVRKILQQARNAARTSLTAPEGRLVCEAYGITTPREVLATSADAAATAAASIGFPVVLKIVSPEILHKTEAGGVRVGIGSAEAARRAYDEIIASARKYDSKARIDGVQVQQMVAGGREVIVGATTDPSFGKLVAFGLGGVLVEVLRDVTFRLAPATTADALGMLDSIRGGHVLGQFRGGPGVNRDALADLIRRVSDLAADHPEIAAVDLNPVFVDERGATAADVRVVLDFDPAPARQRFSGDEILRLMRRVMKPKAVAVIGASAEHGKIGNSIMRNLIGGGFPGAIHPVNPKGDEIEGRTVAHSIDELPDGVDVALFAIPAPLVNDAIAACGRKGIPAAILIPSGFSETGNVELQAKITETAKRSGVRLMGPNIYGYYSTHANLCATFCTPYDFKGPVALSSQSGGIGMAILGFARSAGVGVSAIVGLGNKADIDEDELLTYFEQDDNTQCVAMHMEDLKDGRAFAEAARRVSKKKPVVVLKAGRTAYGAKAASSHTAALAGDDKVYDDILRSAGVVRAPGLNEMLEFARALPMLPTPKGENVVIITGAGGSGVLLSDACADNGLRLLTPMPADLDAAFRKFIPPFGAAGNPVDITGGEPPSTYRNTVALGLTDERIHALVLGYWHTIVTPPMVFANMLIGVVEEHRAKGIDKPIVASLAGDVEVEEACKLLFEHRIVAYPYTTEKPVQVLAAKYRWARAAGRLG